MKKITLLIILLSFPLSSLKAQLTEDFEGGVVPPAGWTSFRGTNNLGTAQDWKISTTAYQGTYAAFNRYENVSGGLAEDWLVTSQVDLTASTNSELRFFTRQDFSNLYSSLYEVRVSTTSQTAHGSFTVVDSWNETTLNSPYNVFVEKIVDLSAYDGMMIYVAFVHTNDNDDGWYIDNVSIASGAACSQPLTSQVSIITDTTTNLSWASVASASNGYEWKVMSSGGDPDVDSPVDSGATAAGTTTASASGLTASTSYDFYVRANCDTDGLSTWKGPVVFTTQANAPVANDLCINAIALTHQTNTTFELATPTAGTIINAYNSTQPYIFCQYGVADVNAAVKDDIWYSFVAATPNVNISYETNFDAVADLFSGTCGGLIKLDCSDNGDPPNAANTELISYSGLTVGQTYYTRVFYIQSTVPANGNVSVKVWTSDTLGVDDVTADENSFTYFPNPVKNTLTLKAVNNIQNVSVYNMLGQEVLRTAPNTIENEVNMSSLQTGAYIVKVTINDNTKTIRIIKQ